MVRVSIALLAVVLSADSFGQDCRRHSAAGGPDGYKPRAGYCDGIISVGYSGGVPHLVGYSQGMVSSSATSVSLAVPANDVAGKMRIQGVAKDASIAYRLDADISRTKSFVQVGPESALLSSDRIDPSGVVFAAFAEGDGSSPGAWLPVRIGVGGGLKVYLRSGDELARIDAQLDGHPISAPEGPFAPNQLIALDVPRDLHGRLRLRVTVHLRRAGADSKELSEWIWVPGRK